MTIRFFANYDSSEGLLHRFLANYNILDNELTFTIGEDYDFAVVFNSTKEFINSSAKVLTIIQEPSWSPALKDNDFLIHSDYIILHDRQLFENTLNIRLGGRVIESPSLMFYTDRVDKSFFQNAVSMDKIRKISMIVSYLNKPLGIYQKRMGLLKKILASDLDIDIYGWRLSIDDDRFKGYIDYKFRGLLPYQYSIAIENSEERNYVTEKFFDCVLCNTIPIYHGAPNIEDIYDPRYYEQINLDSPSVIDQIKSIVANPPLLSTVNKAIYFDEFNLYKKIKEIVLAK